jgi:D-alanine-D-alanine ligase
MDIILLVGGRSTEHQFSIEMFDHFATTLAGRNDDRVRVRSVVYIDLAGLVHEHPICEQKELLLLRGNLTSQTPVALVHLPFILKDRDLFVFSLIQGREGEDGQYQGLAELLDIPGNFGSVYASALGIDKWTFSAIAESLAGRSISAIRSLTLDTDADDRDLDETVRFFSGMNCILKPNSLNGSLFMTSVPELTRRALREALNRVSRYDTRILVQERICGRELTCGCLRMAGELRSLPVGEIVTNGKPFDYKVKYGGTGYEVIFPDETSDYVREVEKISLRLGTFMQFHTMCRFDYILSDSGHLHLLEVNPSPGLLSESIFPRLLHRANLDIVDLIVCSGESDAIARHQRSRRNVELEAWPSALARMSA